MKKIAMICALLPGVVWAQTKKTTTVQKTTVKKTTTTAPSAAMVASINRGKTVYMTNCLPCHQADGSGVPNLNPPLIKTSWVLGAKPALVEQILKGSKGKVVIDGDRFENTMPPMGHLTDEQIADVATYVRNSFGNKASQVTATEVKTVRAKTK